MHAFEAVSPQHPPHVDQTPELKDASQDVVDVPLEVDAGRPRLPKERMHSTGQRHDGDRSSLPSPRTWRTFESRRPAAARARLHAQLLVDSIDSMAQLIVRNIESAVVKQLKLRAVQHGRSTEEEHRELLRSVLLRRPSGTLRDLLQSIPEEGSPTDFDIPRSRARRVKL